MTGEKLFNNFKGQTVFRVCVKWRYISLGTSPPSFMRAPGASRNQIGALRHNGRMEQLARARRTVHSQHTEGVPFRSARARPVHRP